MAKQNAHPDSPAREPVHLHAWGEAARAFVQRLCSEVPEPLVALMAEHPRWLHVAECPAKYRVEDATFLFMVIGRDARAQDIRDALSLLSVVDPEQVSSILVRLYRSSAKPACESLETLADQSGACIEVPESSADSTLEALRWLLATLRGLAMSGDLILESQWDLDDLREVLGIPGARWTLFSYAVSEELSASEALAEAMGWAADDLNVEAAWGLLVLVWQSPEWPLTGAEMRQAVRVARQALGVGGLTMVLRAAAGARWGGHSACITLVVSHPRGYPPLDAVR